MAAPTVHTAIAAVAVHEELFATLAVVVVEASPAPYRMAVGRALQAAAPLPRFSLLLVKQGSVVSRWIQTYLQQQVAVVWLLLWRLFPHRRCPPLRPSWASTAGSARPRT